MSILERIRNKSGLAIIFVGGALALFVISDALQSNSSLFGGQADASVLGEIDGDKIDVKYFEAKVTENEGFYKQRMNQQTIDANTMEMLREQTWTQVLQESVMSKIYAELGIQVTVDELSDMIQGENIHPQISGAPIFQNQQTGQFDRTLVARFLKNLSESSDETTKTQWAQFEIGLKKEAETKKFNTLLGKAIYATKLEAKAKLAERTAQVDYNLVALNYNTVADSTIKIDEGDLKSFFKTISYKYKAKENLRKIDYVLFDIIPSSDDSAGILKWVQDQVTQFAQATNDTLYVDLNSDTKFDTVAHTKNVYPESVQNALFSGNVGDVIGPVFSDGKYRLYKVSGIKEDEKFTMKASHILFRTEGATKEDTLKTLKKAQEVMAEIRRGASFEEKAAQYGTDGTASRGGDLGWFQEGQMVAEFNDYVKKGKKGDMGIVKTQFGIHIVKITEDKTKKAVCAGVLERAIEAGEQTTNMAYNKASQFAAALAGNDDFEKVALEQGVTRRIADDIRENDKNMAGMTDARELVRWAFTAKNNDISDVFSLGNNKFAVAKLTGIREKGKADLESVREKVETEYRKSKKGEMLMAKATEAMKGAKDLNDLAMKLQTAVTPSTAQTFENNNVPYAGPDAKFIGTLFGTTQVNKMSGPVVGENAVYIYTISRIAPADANADTAPYQSEIRSSNASRIEYGSFDLLKDIYSAKDYRYKFY
jgi:peptidyl-prolyl cis-trans isomerase D